MEVALEHCHKNLGDDATILFEYSLPTATFEAIVKEQGKMLGGKPILWLGGQSVVAVTDGTALLEMPQGQKHIWR